MRKHDTIWKWMQLFAFVACVGFVACSDDEGDDPDGPKGPDEVTGTKITSVVSLPGWAAEDWAAPAPEGKSSFTDENGVSAAWNTSGEEFTAFKDGALTTPITFKSTEGTETSMTFESQTEVESPAGTYYATYPEGCTNASEFEIDLTGQDGTLQDDKMYMAATATCTEEGKMDFAFTNLTAILKFELTLPVECVGPVLNASLSASGLKINNTVDVTKSPVEYGSGTTGALSYECRLDLSSDKMVTVYFHVLPGMLSNIMVTLNSDGQSYIFDLEGETLDVQAGNVYTRTMTYVSPEEELGAQLFGTWVLTEYLEGDDQGTYPIEDYEWLYDSETGAGNYWILRGDFTLDNCSVLSDKTGDYFSAEWKVVDENILEQTESSGAVSRYEIVELTQTTLHLRSRYESSWGTWVMEDKFEKVDIDPVNSDEFMLDESSSEM